ncbi:hypothetical protein [Streptomyces sp. NPDC001480]|uniref:hypothetical protein n=1 Tax=Streptomyces sp. NPDC001480 TaxID=3364577 RepID=UPI00367C4B5D
MRVVRLRSKAEFDGGVLAEAADVLGQVRQDVGQVRRRGDELLGRAALHTRGQPTVSRHLTVSHRTGRSVLYLRTDLAERLPGRQSDAR